MPFLIFSAGLATHAPFVSFFSGQTPSAGPVQVALVSTRDINGQDSVVWELGR
jgi:hypothetical protein